ncbi:MAG: TIGR04076 family protein [Clostridia bacterium]|nr:TIGR04076 family protein [Clostridia bacterium]
MQTVRITVMKMVRHDDLITRYENPIEHACDMRVGQTFLSIDGQKPKDMCDSAWESMSPFVQTLANGGGNFYDGWMKDPYSAMISCNDGFRPVSFLLERIEE